MPHISHRLSFRLVYYDCVHKPWNIRDISTKCVGSVSGLFKRLKLPTCLTGGQESNEYKRLRPKEIKMGKTIELGGTTDTGCTRFFASSQTQKRGDRQKTTQSQLELSQTHTIHTDGCSNYGRRKSFQHRGSGQSSSPCKVVQKQSTTTSRVPTSHIMAPSLRRLADADSSAEAPKKLALRRSSSYPSCIGDDRAYRVYFPNIPRSSQRF